MEAARPSEKSERTQHNVETCYNTQVFSGLESEIYNNCAYYHYVLSLRLEKQGVIILLFVCEPGYRSPYSNSLRAGLPENGISIGGENFRTRLDRPWDPSSFLYNWIAGLFQG